MGSKKFRNPEKRQRKAAEKTIAVNTFWDDARDLYHKSVSAINQTHGQLAYFLKTLVADPERVALIKDVTGLVGNINLLSRDIEEHSQRLAAIFATHSEKHGGTSTPDEHLSVIQIHGQYHDALEIYDTTIMPTVTHIFEQIGAIEELLISQEADIVPELGESVEEVADVPFNETQEEKVEHV